MLVARTNGGYVSANTGITLTVGQSGSEWRVVVNSNYSAQSYPTQADAIVALDALAVTLGVYTLS
jgi:hypothetical protein